MRNFFSRYSYSMVRMFINQFAISLFGAVLGLATMIAAGDAKNPALTIVASAFALIFYLFLIYTVSWELGAKDRISIDCGKLRARPYRGFVIALIANVPNYILAIVYTVARIVPPIDDKVEVVARFIASFILDGMYFGFINLEVGGRYLNVYWWTYFVITLPCIIVSGVAYIIGTKNLHFTKMLEHQYPESDREPKKKWFGKKDK